MTPLLLALNSALLHLLWQGMAVALLLWVALAALRNRAAEARYLVSCAALGILTLAPVVTMCLVYQRPSGMVPLRASIWIASVPVAFEKPASASTDLLASLQAWILPAWAFGVALLSMRLLWAHARVASLKRAGGQAEPHVLALAARLSERLGVTSRVRVLISSLPYPSDGLGPCVIGWLRPVILLPAATLLGLTQEQLEAVLAHELAHIRRYDYLVNVVQMLIETLFFYHPAVWWISTRIRRERELCCDDIAVRCCGDAIGYARALTALERMRVMPMERSLALGVKDGPLMYRIQRLLGSTPREQGPSRLPGIVAILLAVACFSTNMNPAKAQAPLPQPPQPSVPSLSAPQMRRPVRVLLPLAQVNQPAAFANPPGLAPNVGGPVTVEVTIDQDGEVSDAHVVNGPMAQRRAALLMALNMRFRDTPSTIRQVDVLSNTLTFFGPMDGIQRTMTVTEAEAQDQIKAASERINKLRAQQAEASVRGAAQLQEAIDGNTRAIEKMQAILSGPNPLLGKTLEDIRITGVQISNAAREQLLAQLPFRLHDVLSDTNMGAAMTVVKAMYPSSDAYFGTIGASGQAAFVIQVGGPARLGPMR